MSPLVKDLSVDHQGRALLTCGHGFSLSVVINPLIDSTWRHGLLKETDSGILFVCLFVHCFGFFFNLCCCWLWVWQKLLLYCPSFSSLQNCNFLMQDPLEKWAGGPVLCIEVEIFFRFQVRGCLPPPWGHLAPILCWCTGQDLPFSTSGKRLCLSCFFVVMKYTDILI